MSHPMASPELVQNPYPFYESMRRKGAFCRDEFFNGYFVTGYAWIEKLLKDKRLHSGGERFTAMFSYYSDAEQAEIRPLSDSLGRWALFSDGEQHVRRRSMLARAFTPAMVGRLRGFVETLCDELLAEVMHEPAWDFMRQVAIPLPVLVIGRLLGVPAEDLPRLKRWSEDLARLIGIPLRAIQVSRDANQSILELDEYFSALLKRRRARPEDDLISGFASRELGMSDADVVANCSQLLFAGHETTTNLLGNGVYLLMCHREHWRKCLEGAHSIANLVEEILRFESPVQYQTRVVGEQADYEGVVLKPRERVFLLSAAANRDPAVFAEPNRFDPARANARAHFAFGAGAHFCLGASLSRLEGAVLFEKLLARCPKLSSPDVEHPNWRSILGLRGLASLRVRH